MHVSLHRLPIAVLLALLPTLACQSSGETSPRRGEPEPYVPLPDEEPETIGYFLTRFDRSLLKWSELKLASSSPRDQNALQALEANMQKRARDRRDELLAELQTGSPANRRISAVALGFSGDPSVLGALLACLDERDPELVQKALLGIGVLSLPETPVASILDPLLEGSDPWTRNNAAFALLSLAQSGLASPELAAACRAGLADAEPGVRAQCASALGVLADPEAVAVLSDMLFDEASLVVLACSAALARIGREHAVQKGTVARNLASVLDRVKADRRVHVLGALRWLSEMNLGEDAKPWLEWAHRLP